MARSASAHRQDQQQVLVHVHSSIVVQVDKVFCQAVLVAHLSSSHPQLQPAASHPPAALQLFYFYWGIHLQATGDGSGTCHRHAHCLNRTSHHAALHKMQACFGGGGRELQPRAAPTRRSSALAELEAELAELPVSSRHPALAAGLSRPCSGGASHTRPPPTPQQAQRAKLDCTEHRAEGLTVIRVVSATTGTPGMPRAVSASRAVLPGPLVDATIRNLDASAVCGPQTGCIGHGRGTLPQQGLLEG